MRIIYLALLLFVSLFLSGCNGGQQRDTQAGEKLLATLFTSNQDGRWDTFQAALENGDDVETAYLDYMATYQPFCTADGLDKVTSNRYSTQCDSLAQQNNVTIQPGEVAISAPDQNGVSTFTLPIVVMSDGQETGNVTLEGQLIFAEEDGALLVDNLSIYNLSDLSTTLTDD